MSKIYKVALLALSTFLLYMPIEISAQEEVKNELVDSTSEVSTYDYLNDGDVEIIDEDVVGDGSFPAIFVDWGFHICAKNKNEGLKTGFWGSRFVGISINYNLAIPDSRFALGVGIGYDNKTFSFKESGSEFYTLIRDSKKDRNTVAVLAKDSLAAKEDPSSKYLPKCKGSYLNTHFLDLIFDVRFFLDRLYPKDSFIFSIGTKIGILLGSNAEIRYSQDGTTKEQCIYDKLNLKDVHWGFQARASWRRFGLIYEVILSDLFKKDHGPAVGYMQKFGISLDLL